MQALYGKKLRTQKPINLLIKEAVQEFIEKKEER
jgi:hypothetical protein